MNFFVKTVIFFGFFRVFEFFCALFINFRQNNRHSNNSLTQSIRIAKRILSIERYRQNYPTLICDLIHSQPRFYLNFSNCSYHYFRYQKDLAAAVFVVKLPLSADAALLRVDEVASQNCLVPAAAPPEAAGFLQGSLKNRSLHFRPCSSELSRCSRSFPRRNSRWHFPMYVP